MSHRWNILQIHIVSYMNVIKILFDQQFNDCSFSLYYINDLAIIRLLWKFHLRFKLYFWFSENYNLLISYMSLYWNPFSRKIVFNYHDSYGKHQNNIEVKLLKYLRVIYISDVNDRLNVLSFIEVSVSTKED